jgi:outer membrane lipoprotein SlyB
MKRMLLSAILLPFVLINPLRAGTAQDIQYGVVQDVRVFTQNIATATAPTSRPLRTAAGAAVGGAIGHQFGGGDGQDVATAVGAMAGARASRQRQAAAASAATSAATQQMVELTIKTDAGKLLSITQEHQPDVAFVKGEKVKILSSANDTHVEKTN